MKALIKSFRYGITAKLVFLNLIIFIIFGITTGVMIRAFRNIENLTGNIIGKNVKQIVHNAQTDRELSTVFDKTRILTSTFYKDELAMEAVKKRLLNKIDYLSAMNMDEKLKASFLDFKAKLELLFEQCERINAISRETSAINNKTVGYLTVLELVVFENMVSFIMERKDISVLEQISMLLPSYRETLLKASLRFASIEPIRSDTRDAEPVVKLLSELHFKLRPLLDSDPDVADSGQNLMDTVSEYKENIVSFNNAIIEFHVRLERLNTAKHSAVAVMKKVDRDIAGVLDLMRGENKKVMQSSISSVYTISVVFIGLIALFTYVFFLLNIRRPMASILEGLESIGDGNLDTRIELARNDEWGMVEDSINRMVSEIWHSYSELYHKNEELRDSEERLNRAQAVAHVGSWELNIPSKKTWGSKEAFKIYGLIRVTSYLPADEIQNIICEQDRQRMGEALKLLLEGKNNYDEEFRIIRENDKEQRIIHSRAELVNDEKGAPLKVLGTVQDITELKQTEEALNRTRLYLNNILNSMPSVLIGIDLEGNVTQWNIAAEKETSISSKQAVGKMLTDIFPNYSRFFNDMKQSILENKPIIKEKIPQPRSDRQTRYLNMMIYPVVSDKVDGAVLRIDDVTEKVCLEDMLIQAEKMMSVGGLAAGMAHEINNPLGVIMQGVQNAVRRLSTELDANIKVADECGVDLKSVRVYMEKRGILRYLDGIQDAGSRASKIVSNMLNFSRRSESKMAPSDINGLIDNTVELAANDYDLKRKFDFRNIEITRDYEPDIPRINCTATEIEQVFLNLLKNSAQAMAEIKEKKEKPEIILRTRQETDWVLIEVEDNGPGMDEKIRKRIFEPFYTTKTVGIGTGLGLSVSYFIITNNHKGTMSVESEPGVGAKFTIRLPLRR
ncbi:MAG: PAS domain S-box protein [Desulfobacteraceae bacterium]|nr:PAS domain S-box protein [Desulfobacteraceae bacterium]